MFDTAVINLIIFTFPLTIYIIYCIYANVLNRKVNNLVFVFSLITSFYFLIRFGTREIDYLPLILTETPFLLAINNKNNIGVVLSSILILIYYYTVNINIFIYMLILFIIEYILFIVKNKSFNHSKLLIIIMSFFNVIPFVIFFSIDIELIIYILGSIFLPCLIVLVESNCETVANIHINLQSIEHEKQVKLSIFKIAHEIKNPIAVCKGYLDMLDINNKDNVEKYIPIVKSEIERTLCLLQDFLDFNKIKLDKEKMDLIVLLDDIKLSCSPLLKGNKIKYNIFINDDDEIYLVGDYNRLKQVFINIIKNSIEALENRNNPNISISYKLKKDYVHVYIEDNGCGMSREVLSRINEPFFTTKGTGTGLGITISQEIIQGHGGIIKYSSKKDLYTKVEVILPIDKQK